MPNLFFLVTILAVVFLVYFAKERNRTPMSIQISPESPQENSESVFGNIAQHKSKFKNILPEDQAKVEVTEVQQWVKAEAASLNSTAVKLEEKEAVITHKVRLFGAHQLEELKKISLNSELPMNERILSTYILSKAESSRQALVDVAAAATENKKYEPHTEDEIKAISERSLRIMAINDIISRLDSVENKLDDLQQIVNKTNDDVVKKYALDQARTLKQ